MRILVTGARGLLGSEVVRAAAARGHDTVPLGHDDLDVTDAERVLAAVTAESPDRIVHCAAYTAVDGAEAEPDVASRVNRDGTRNVARAAAASASGMVYVSTDFVFDGLEHAPYLPDHPVAPLSVYGRTKRDGEEAVLEVAAQGAHGAFRPLIVRTGWLYGAEGRNFVDAMVERAARGEALRVVDDQTGGPTWARNVADILVELMEREVDGIWHVADRGEATWLELARTAVRLSGLEANVGGVSTAEWGAPAPRPPYSVLDVTRTERLLGRRMEPWPEALARFLGTEGEERRER